MDLLELLDIRMRIMWTHDADGRITTENRPDGRPAPRAVVSRSSAGPVWRFGPAVSDAQAAELAVLFAADDDWTAETPANVDAILAVLGGASVEGGPNFRPTATMTAPAGDTVLVTPESATVLDPLMGDWHVDVGTRDPVVAALVDGHAVAVCMSARIGPELHEAGVETHPDHRGRGHGLAAVSAWRIEVERMGATPLYCTARPNVASQRLARAAGFEHYANDLYLR